MRLGDFKFSCQPSWIFKGTLNGVFKSKIPKDNRSKEICTISVARYLFLNDGKGHKFDRNIQNVLTKPNTGYGYYFKKTIINE